MKKVLFWFYSVTMLLVVVFKIDFHHSLKKRISEHLLMRFAGYDNVNTKLFRTLKMYVNNIDSTWAIFNVLGNTLPFYIYGVLLKFAWKNKAFLELFCLSAFGIVLCEIFQYVFLLGTCDIDDVLMNLVFLALGINFPKSGEMIDFERSL